MRNLLIAACCAALVGSISVVSAQTTGPAAQESMKKNSPMDSNAKMKKTSKTKKSTKSDDSMKGDMSNEGMKKDTKYPLLRRKSRDALRGVAALLCLPVLHGSDVPFGSSRCRATTKRSANSSMSSVHLLPQARRIFFEGVAVGKEMSVTASPQFAIGLNLLANTLVV